MGKIILEGMQFKSHIGVYDYEQQYGNNFEVDIELTSNMIVSDDDDVSKTIDYEIVYAITRQTMSKRFKLIESACNEILTEIQKQIQGIDTIQVRIAKVHPPLGAEVKKVIVEMNYMRKN